MPTYLMHESFPKSVWRSIVDGSMDPNPFSNPNVLKEGVSTLGGTVMGSWLSCEDCEYLWIVEMPGNIDVTGMTLMNLARGNDGPIRITPLLSTAEAAKAVELAGKTLGYAESEGYRMNSGKGAPEETPESGVKVTPQPSAALIPLDVNEDVYHLTEKYPGLIDVFIKAGHTQVRNKVLLKTLGRTMPLKMTLNVVSEDGVRLINKLRAAGFDPR
jgi:hypothetical protein